MSTPSEELRAIERAWELLLDLASGDEKRIPSTTRKRARDTVKHFPFPVMLRELYEKAGRRDVTRIREGALSAERTPTCPPEKARLVPVGTVHVEGDAVSSSPHELARSIARQLRPDAGR